MNYTHEHDRGYGLGWISTVISGATYVFNLWDAQDSAGQQSRLDKAAASLAEYNAGIAAEEATRNAGMKAQTDARNQKILSIASVAAGAIVLGVILGKKK